MKVEDTALWRWWPVLTVGLEVLSKCDRQVLKVWIYGVECNQLHLRVSRGGCVAV